MEEKESFWQSRKSNALDIIIVSATYFYVIFFVALHEDSFPILLSAYILGGFLILYVFFFSQLLHKDTNAERGFGSWKKLFIRTDNLKKSAKDVLLILTSIMVISIFIISLILGTFWTPAGGGFSEAVFGVENLAIDFIAQFIYYIGWGFLQQVLFLSFIHVRLRKILPGTDRRNQIYISLLTGAIFGSYHLLNIPLALFTFISGTFWAWNFYETPNMLTVSISHGLGGTLSSMFIFNYNGWNMNVGWPGAGFGP